MPIIQGSISLPGTPYQALLPAYWGCLNTPCTTSIACPRAVTHGPALHQPMPPSFTGILPLPSSLPIVLLIALYTYREPYHAVPPVVSLSRVISYQQRQGAPSGLTRHCMCPALNQSAQCACSLGAVTLRANISPRTTSSAGNKPPGTQPQTTWTQQKMGTSTLGLLTLHRRIRSSRCSSAISLS